MSDRLLNVEVVTRHETLWVGASGHVSVPAVDGRLGILPGRQPVLAVLEDGIVDVSRPEGDPVKIQVKGGFVSVDADFITVVVDEGTVIN